MRMRCTWVSCKGCGSEYTIYPQLGDKPGYCNSCQIDDRGDQAWLKKELTGYANPSDEADIGVSDPRAGLRTKQVKVV